MINVNMTDKAGVTLATAGKYCADNVKVTPSAEILRKDEQAKTATPTTSAQDITPDAGKALSKVTVNPITAAIVGNLDASSFAASIVAAVEGKGVTVPSGTLLDGMAALIESIEAGGGGGIELPTGYKVSTGTYTPNTEGTNVEHNIKIASSCPQNNPCRMFCIYRVDGFDASGSDSSRYLTFYVGAYAKGQATSGAVLYRGMNASTLTCAGGAETTDTPNYGLPINCFTQRTNCYVRNISLDGVLKFSTYGIITLESGKTYKWFALLPSDAEV